LKLLNCLPYIQGNKFQEDEIAGHVARMGERRNLYRILVGKPEEKKRPLGRRGVDGKIILKWILNSVCV
jgi:hypothetical protein